MDGGKAGRPRIKGTRAGFGTRGFFSRYDRFVLPKDWRAALSRETTLQKQLEGLSAKEESKVNTFQAPVEVKQATSETTKRLTEAAKTAEEQRKDTSRLLAKLKKAKAGENEGGSGLTRAKRVRATSTIFD